MIFVSAMTSRESVPRSTHWSIPILVLATLAAGSVAFAEGQIVPVATEGIHVKDVAGQSAAFFLVGPVRTIVSTQTGNGFLIVRLMLENRGPGPIPVARTAVTLLPNQGDSPIPITPERYVEMRYQVNPQDLSESGNPKSLRGMVNHAGPSAGSTGEMLDRSMYDDGRDSSWGSDEIQGGRELRELRAGLLYRGGSLGAGDRAQERLVFQRNHIQVPFDLAIKLGEETRIVHFDRK